VRSGYSKAIFIVTLVLCLFLRTSPTPSQVVPSHVELVVLILKLLYVLSVVLLQINYHQCDVIWTALLYCLRGYFLAYLSIR
jgi:hypothetical protein